MTAVVPPATAELGSEESPAGFGLATGRVVRFDPQAGGFSFGGEFASVKSLHQVTAARADVRSVDPGTLGVSLAGQGCDGEAPLWPQEDQPQPMIVDSRDDGAGDGRADEENGFERTARADESPSATGSVQLAPLGLPGALLVDGARASASSGHLGDGVREAVADVRISSISVAGGLVVLRDLRWHVRHRSGADEAVEAVFDIGGADIAGTPVSGVDPAEIIGVVDDVLANLGLRLQPPAVRDGEGTLFVEPLRIAVEPNATRDLLASELLTLAQPARQAVVDVLLEASCGSGALLTIGDLLVGSVTGSGSFTIELGGVSATTRPVLLTTGLGVANPSAPAPETAPPTAPATAAPAVARPSSRLTTTTTAPAGTVAAPPPAVEVAAPQLVTGTPARSRDLAAAVGIGAMALGLLLALGDRRAMRHAQATAGTED